jgi:hypothetical protein
MPRQREWEEGEGEEEGEEKGKEEGEEGQGRREDVTHAVVARVRG